MLKSVADTVIERKTEFGDVRGGIRLHISWFFIL